MVTKRSRGKLINRAAAAAARLALSAVEILIKRLMACAARYGTSKATAFNPKKRHKRIRARAERENEISDCALRTGPDDVVPGLKQNTLTREVNVKGCTPPQKETCVLNTSLDKYNFARRVSLFALPPAQRNKFQSRRCTLYSSLIDRVSKEGSVKIIAE